VIEMYISGCHMPVWPFISILRNRAAILFLAVGGVVAQRAALQLHLGTHCRMHPHGLRSSTM
jgi:hypothetical protein